MQQDSYVDPKSEEAKKFTVQLQTRNKLGPGIGLSKGMRRLAEDDHDNAVLVEKKEKFNKNERPKETINMLREEKQTEFPDTILLSKYRGPTFDRETEVMGKLRGNLENALKQKYDEHAATFGRSIRRAAGLGGFDHEMHAHETEGTTPREQDSPRQTPDYVRDPFELLQKKEKANEVVQASIENFLMTDKEAQRIERVGYVDQAQARRLAEGAMRTLKKEKVTGEDFNDFNFDTGFRIYAESDGSVPLNQLQSFIKNVADI